MNPGPIRRRRTCPSPESPPSKSPNTGAGLARVHESMDSRSLDALVLFSPHNVFYLSGMDTENLSDYQCLLVPAGDDPILVTSHFEEARAANSCWHRGQVFYGPFEDPIQVTLDAVRRLKVRTLGLEQRNRAVSPDHYQSLAAGIVRPADRRSLRRGGTFPAGQIAGRDRLHAPCRHPHGSGCGGGLRRHEWRASGIRMWPLPSWRPCTATAATPSAGDPSWPPATGQAAPTAPSWGCRYGSARPSSWS